MKDSYYYPPKTHSPSCYISHMYKTIIKSFHSILDIHNVVLTILLVLGSRAIRCPCRSNRRTCRLSCGMAIRPPELTAIRFTLASERMVARAERMLRRSHTYIQSKVKYHPNITRIRKKARYAKWVCFVIQSLCKFHMQK